MPRSASLRHDRRGSVALEFAAIASLLLALCIGMIEVGMLFWAQNSFQAAAVETARCVAIGSTSCSNAQSYAVSMVEGWMFAGAVDATNVTASAPGSCNGVSSSNGFESVTISKSYAFGFLPQLLGSLASGLTISATACYPK